MNPDQTTTAAPTLDAYTETDQQVWVLSRETGQPIYAYRTGLIQPVARNWAEAWNRKAPEDLPTGTRFAVVTATTTFTTQS